MQITLQNTEKGQCYAVRFDRYRQQVVDKLKTAVSVRWWDKSTGAWMIPANNKCKAELDQLTYYVRHFEPVNWGGYDRRGHSLSNTGHARVGRGSWPKDTTLPLSTARNRTRLTTKTVYQWGRHGPRQDIREHRYHQQS